MPAVFAEVYVGYMAALDRAPLDADTRRAYDSASADSSPGWTLVTPTATRSATAATSPSANKTHLKTVLGRADNTVNAHITALDHFYEHLGLGPVKLRRDAAPKLAHRPRTETVPARG